MRKNAALMLILAFLTASCLADARPSRAATAAAVEDTWTAKAPMQQARAGLGVVAVNGKIYAIGGSTANGSAYPPDIFAGGFVGTNEVYDPETDTWSYRTPMPTPRAYFAIAAYKNKIYCIGGAIGFNFDARSGFYSYITSGVNEVYDTVTDTWETKRPLSDDAMSFQAHVVNGKIYVMDWSHTYVYDPERNSWSLKKRMPPPYPDYDSSPVSAVVDNKIIVTFEFSDSQVVSIYDVENDSWSRGASSPTALVEGAAAATTGVKAPEKVYVLGFTATTIFPILFNQVYDHTADTWITATSMPTNRSAFGIAVVNDVLYVIGGYLRYPRSVSPTAVNEQYFPLGYGVPPKIKVVSPANQAYNESSVALTFAVDKPAAWMGYSLDGQDVVAVAGNTTLSELQNGVHNLTVYTTDQYGNTGASETVCFRVEASQPLLILAIGVASAAAIAGVVGYVLYHRKRRTR
ncbi:MAG: kelch repeat-containing protein [Candidatus Bathyarchaeia archaeon]